MAENIKRHVSLLLREVWYLIHHVQPNIVSKYCPLLEARVYMRLHMKGLIKRYNDQIFTP